MRIEIRPTLIHTKYLISITDRLNIMYFIQYLLGISQITLGVGK